MTELLTTFREAYEDNSELHESAPAREVIALSDDVLDEINKLEQLYNEGMDPALQHGMGLWIPGAHYLNRLPTPNALDKKQPNVFLFPLLDAFGKFLHARSHEIFQETKPTFIRVLAFGPEARKAGNWHCDLLIDRDGKGSFMSRVVADAGRLVVGVDSQLRDDILANIRFVDGSFVVNSIVPEVEHAEHWQDLSQGYQPDVTVVTRETGSVINISDPAFQPSADLIKGFGNYTLTDTGCTTLHIGISVPDALRVSLQCSYEGLSEKDKIALKEH